MRDARTPVLLLKEQGHNDDLYLLNYTNMETYNWGEACLSGIASQLTVRLCT